MNTPPISFERHRLPREIEEMLLERGIVVSYETIRRWTAKFAPQIAQNLQRAQARPGDT